MFGLLKQKLSGFLDKLSKREDEKETPAEQLKQEKAREAEAQKEKEIPKEKPARKEEKAAVEERKSGAQKKQALKAEEPKPAGRKEEEKAAPAKEKGLPKVEKKQENTISEVQAGEAKKESPGEIIGERKEAAPEKIMAVQKEEVRTQAQPQTPVANQQKIAKMPEMEKEGQERKEDAKPEQTDGKSQSPQKPPTPEPIVSAPPMPAADAQKSHAQDKPADEMKRGAGEERLEKKELRPAKAPEVKKGFGFGDIWPFGKKSEAPKVEEAQKKPEGVAPKTPETTETSEAKPPLEMDFERLGKKAQSGEKKMEVRMGLARTMSTLLTNTVEIREDDVRDLIDELELAMLESDVAYEVALEVASKLKAHLVGMRVEKNKMQPEIRKAMAEVLSGVLRSEKEFDFIERVKASPKPAKILFIGPNGAGKTTTMAKIAKKLQVNGMTCVISASDTFRAAAIEQAEVHANRLGVHIVKSKYGADPAAVAYDAIGYARAHGIDAVLIDSAGRQDTNSNLLDELKKITRVVKPDLKIYIGESIGGNAVIDQIKGFSESIGLDGVILTKIDCDAKGGTALSVSHATGTPIIYLGTGQGYDDLEKFDAAKIASQLVGEAS